jgi:hypothetical protein
LGPEAFGLSANTETWLVEQCQEEHEAWCRRDLLKKQYVYFWVDLIYVNVPLDGERQCLLIVLGPRSRAQRNGCRPGWDPRGRGGLKTAPKLLVGRGP